MMKNVMVTGAAGFLGSHLARWHLQAGDRVWGVDNFCSSSPVSAHLVGLLQQPGFVFIESDIDAPLHTWWADNLSPRLDVIYNFACPASPPLYQKQPLLTLMTCVVGTNNVLSIASRDGAILVHASTSEVYGDPNISPQDENYRGSVNSYGPRACYDEGKRAAEALCYIHHSTHGTDARLVRIFNTYGPNMDPTDGRVVSNFICQALRGEPLTIYGTGAQTRSLCYVDDLIRGIVAVGALHKNPLTPINLGNPQEFTIIELATQVIAKINGAKMLQHHHALPIDDPQQRCPDITLARDILKWDPKVSLSDGLDLSIDYFRKVIK